MPHCQHISADATEYTVVIDMRWQVLQHHKEQASHRSECLMHCTDAGPAQCARIVTVKMVVMNSTNQTKAESAKILP